MRLNKIVSVIDEYVTLRKNVKAIALEKIKAENPKAPWLSYLVFLGFYIDSDDHQIYAEFDFSEAGPYQGSKEVKIDPEELNCQ